MSRGPIILSSSDDWQIWLNQIKVFAKSRGVWEYVDPDCATPKTATEPPAPRCSDVRSTAQSLRELGNDELTRWLLLTADHDMAMKRYEDVRGRLGEVHMEIIHTVSKPNQRYLVGRETARDSLRRLAKEFQARPMSIQEFRARWCDMETNPPDGNLDNWLAKWHFLYNEGKALNAREVEQGWAAVDFLDAVKMIAPRFANENFGITMCEDIDFPWLLRKFSKWKRLNPDQVYAPETTSNGDSGTTPEVPTPNSFERPASEAPVGIAGQPKKSRRTGPSCICGQNHWFSDCAYVVEALRPDPWLDYDPEIKAKFDHNARYNPRFKAALKSAARRGNKKHKDAQPRMGWTGLAFG